MAKSFDEILTSMLEQLENNPDQDIDVLVKGECEKMGVSEESMALLSETNEYIDGFAERMAALQKAKEEGRSRKQWMLEEMHITKMKVVMSLFLMLKVKVASTQLSSHCCLAAN